MKVQGLPDGVSALAVGLLHACALAQGQVYCWGYKLDGSLAKEVDGPYPVPVQVAGLGPAPAIFANGSTCASDPTTHKQYSRVPVPVGFTSEVTAMKMGGMAGCAIVNGAVYCWGDNYYGLLGTGTRGSSPIPVKADFSACF